MRKKLIVVAALAALVSMIPPSLADDSRGYLGVSLQFTESIHQDGRVPEAAGVYVSAVFPGGAAEAAGLMDGDRIVALDGRSIADMDTLQEMLGATREGDRLAVTVERDGVQPTIEVTLGAMPTKATKLKRYVVAVDPAQDRAFVGIESQDVGPQLARYFGVDGGILVGNVIEGTAAQEAGIEAGDVIVAWEGNPIRSVSDLHRVISESKPGDQVELSVSRRGVTAPVFVTLGSARGFKMKHAEKHMADHPDDLHFGHEGDVKFKVKAIEKKGGGV